MIRRVANIPAPHFAALLACVVVLGCAAPASADPRIVLVELQISSNDDEALRLIEQALAEDPQGSRRLGFDYLRGHLLLRMERRREAREAFAATMNATPQLGPYSRYRLALEQEALGHPEVAAGLVATLLRSGTPRNLVSPAVRLLRRTVLEGGDCGVLRGLEASRLRTGDRRELALAAAECLAREGQTEGAYRSWISLLEEDRGDPVARVAAERLDALGGKERARTSMLIGLAFHHHREFEIAIGHLARALVRIAADPPSSHGISQREMYELRYALARSHFWEERYAEAAASFGSLAGATSDPRRRAQSLYQQARCYELSGRWREAVGQFRKAYQTEPGGSWADSALIAQMRLKWRQNDEAAALDALEQLLAKRQYGTASRAMLFLASSDLVMGRGDRAGAWLGKATDLRRVAAREVHYWKGRLAEIEQKPAAAVEEYLRTLIDDPYHPLAQAARRRLSGSALAAAAQVKAAGLANSSLAEELYHAWLLLPPTSAVRSRVHRQLEEKLSNDQNVTAYLHLDAEPAAAWPLWSSRLEQPEEMLLALGLFHEGGSKVLRHFPVARPELAFTGSLVLARNGDTRRSLYIAEILSKRVPRTLPPPLWPETFHQLLYPPTYSSLIFSEARRRNVDPHLLAGLIREESRFDPQAFSAASARGLTQFVFPTAREVAKRHQIGEITPQDLERPEIAIALGAAYLRQLYDELGGSLPDVIAAYNAGEPQSALWRKYCLSDEPEEYLTKVAFRETRNYLARVLTSRAHYVELYPLEDKRPGNRTFP